MQIIQQKKKTEKNLYYGVDLNDKKAVEREFRKRNNIHRLVTLIAILAIAALGVVFFDFYRVNFVGGKPIFAKSTKVKNGTLFEGIGYSVLYCNDGERHVGAVIYADCLSADENSNTFKEVLSKAIIRYAEDNKMSSKGSIEDIVINEFYHDEDIVINNETIEDKIKKDAEKKDSLIDPNRKEHKSKDDTLEFADYYVDFSVVCKKGDNCLKFNKDFNDISHVRVIVRFDWFNDVSDFVYVKNSGLRYQALNEEYGQKIKDYLRSEGKINEDNIRSLDVRFLDTKGKVNFRGTTYADSYLIQLVYMCNDNSNTCITPYDKEDEQGDYANLSFQATMFLDANDNIVSMGPKEYFGL